MLIGLAGLGALVFIAVCFCVYWYCLRTPTRGPILPVSNRVSTGRPATQANRVSHKAPARPQPAVHPPQVQTLGGVPLQTLEQCYATLNNPNAQQGEKLDAEMLIRTAFQNNGRVQDMNQMVFQNSMRSTQRMLDTMTYNTMY